MLASSIARIVPAFIEVQIKHAVGTDPLPAAGSTIRVAASAFLSGAAYLIALARGRGLAMTRMAGPSEIFSRRNRQRSVSDMLLTGIGLCSLIILSRLNI